MKSESNTVTKRKHIVYRWQRGLPSTAKMKRANVVSVYQTPDVVTKNSQVCAVDDGSGLSPAVNIIHTDDDNASPSKVSILTGARLLGRWVGTVID